MPHSIPTYKITRVTAKIAVILYFRAKGKNPSKRMKEYLPIAIGLVPVVAVNLVPDPAGLLIVAFKVAKRIAAIEGIDLPIDGAYKKLGYWPTGQGEGYIIEQDTFSLESPSSIIFGFFASQLKDKGLAGEIVSVIFEEFDLTDIKSLFLSMFDFGS